MFTTLAEPADKRITVDPETYRVTADGMPLTGQPAREVPLARIFSLF